MKTNRSHVYHILMSASLALMLGTAYFQVTDTHASPIIKYCERQYETFRFHPMTPRAEQRCDLLFKKWTYEWEKGLYSNY